MKELHVCAGLNACYQHGKSGTNACAGTGDCATVVNNSCHGNNDCRGQGGCGAAVRSVRSRRPRAKTSAPAKGTVMYRPVGIDASRTMAATGEQAEPGHKARPNSKTAITGIYEGRHVWQVARLLFEQRMMAQGRSFTTDPTLLGPQPPADIFSAANNDFLYFGSPPADKALGPNTTACILPDRPSYQSSSGTLEYRALYPVRAPRRDASDVYQRVD